MNDNEVVIKYLKELGYDFGTEYYNNINYWKTWYKNFVRDFHLYHDQNGTLRQLYRLGMAKKVCEDWSSILFTERDEVIFDKTKNQEYWDRVLKEKKLNKLIADNIEMAFASGTCGTTIRLKNVIVKNNEIIGDDKSTFDIVSVDANQVIPLLIENGNIIDVAINYDTIINNKKAYYVEIHNRQKDNTYKITTICLDENGKEIQTKGLVKEYYTKSIYPLFNLLTPHIVNNIDNNNGLGISILANAIDQLKGCDIAYNNYVKDTELGGKKVFYDKSLLKYKTVEVEINEETERKEVPIYPDDITKQQFQILGDEFGNSGANADTLFHEYNPSLRIDENEKNVNYALMLLSFMMGMGKYYRFENGSVVTATQYLGENKDLVNSAKKHRSNLNDYVVGLARSILVVGRLIFNENVDETDNISLTDKDGFLVSDEELREQWRNDFNSGLMSKKEYLMKARGVSEEEAIRIIQEINEEEPDVDDVMGGDK